jgi:hydroxypyruvate isomerase
VSAAELLVEPPLTSVAVRGGDLAVAVWPPAEGANADLGGSVGSAPPVVAIHGITATHRAWPHLAAALPDRTVIAPDLRGRGRSRSLPRPVGMATHADDVAAVIASHAGEFGHIQIADAPGRGEPGTGELPLEQWIADAQAGGYAGVIGLEYKATQADPFAWITPAAAQA